MEYEQTKEYLKRYRKNRALVNRLKDKIATYDERLTGLKSPSFSGMPKSHNYEGNDDILSHKAETEKRIKRLDEKGAVMRQEILDAIDTLDNVLNAQVLEMFCIDCMSISEIAEEIGYSDRRVASIYSKAIQCIMTSL